MSRDSLLQSGHHQPHHHLLHHHPQQHQRTTGPSDSEGHQSVLIDYGNAANVQMIRTDKDGQLRMPEQHPPEMMDGGGGRGRPGVILRAQSHGKILETHFDDPPQHHTRSSSYSMTHSYQDRPMVNLNNSFPGTGTNNDSSNNSVPYISSSVTLPASSAGSEAGFYHNVSGRIRQPSLRHKEEARNSFARQADLHKSPRTQELEEFAAKFEGYQKQRTRRLATQPTPMLDQLARETNSQFWLQTNPDQLSTLESSLLRLVQRNDSINTSRARALFSDDNSSGRESVTTVISNSSSETIKFNERHSSSETLRYCDGDDGESVTNITEAVRQARDRTHSICDEYLGHQGVLMHDTNFNTWRLKQRLENNNGGYWENHGSHQNGVSSYNNKRSLYRSHSEAGSGTLVRNGNVDTCRDTWTDHLDQDDGVSNRHSMYQSLQPPRDDSHHPQNQQQQLLDYLSRDEVTAMSGKWMHDTWQNSNSQVQSGRGSIGGCSYCSSPSGADTCLCAPVTRQAGPQDVGMSDNASTTSSSTTVEKNTFPRRSTRNKKPKLPTPPCSPPTGSKIGSGRSCTPSPPPPPPHPDQEQLISSLNEPLPPPPVETLTDNKSQGPKTNVLQATSSSTPTPIPSTRNKTPANTPKRESPATIAAKEAPGWEKFLGVKSQTVSFTSEEATKFRAARDESRSRNGNSKKEEARVRQQHEDGRSRAGSRSSVAAPDHCRVRNQQNIQRRDVLNNFFHKMEENNKIEAKVRQQGSSENTPRRRREEIRNSQKKYHAVRNSGSDENHNIPAAASPDDKQQSLHLSRERSLKSISNWWKNSLEGGPTPPTWTDGDSPSPRHNHSHSDSGISSMSGRSSCMSPMSELSSSSGSSRTSLRSSSIVSASNILLEEEGETEMEYSDLCKELLMFAPSDTRIVGLIRDSLKPWLQVYFPEGSLEFEIITMKENCELEPSKRSRSTNFEESRKNLLKHACMRIDTQRKHQQLLKESTKNNEEVGKEILSELKAVCQQQEIDKVKLFTEEVDKITSLIIGLSSRLAKANAASAKNTHSDEKLQRMEAERREKLEEQLEEARKLRQSIFRRGDLVFGILGKYLDPRSVDSFGVFIKEKIRLILENRQHTEMLKSEEEILKSLKEYNSVTGVMII